MENLAQEANIFANYLVGRQATPKAVQIYTDAVKDSQPNAIDQRLLSFMKKHPRMIGLIDAGLVFHDSTSEARRRLYLMLAILEASPENCDLFLPTKRSPLYLLTVAYTGTRAVAKAVIGLILVKALSI